MSATQEFFSGLEDVGAAQSAAQTKAWERRKLVHDTKRINDALHRLTSNRYHVSVPLDEVNNLLYVCGFDELQPMLLCGREGRLHENVGRNRWLSLTWYKMESGRYEVVAYVS